MKNYIALFVAVVFALCSAPSGHCQAYSALTTKLKNNQLITGNETVQGNGNVGGTFTVGGLTTLSTPLTLISAENAIKCKVVPVDIGPTGALANSTVYTSTTPIGFACTVIGITLAAHVAPVGGTNTVAVQKNGTTTMLSTATMDPTTLTSLVGKPLTLTGTPANLTLAASDTIDITYTSGVQGTAANGPVFSIVVLPTADF
jgi:hypothetical protein